MIPKKWFDYYKGYVRKLHPNYTEEQIRKAVGFTWYHVYTNEERKKIILIFGE